MKILNLILSFLCTVLSQNIATNCGKYIQITGHDAFAGYYSYHGVLNNKPGYYNSKKNMYLYATQNGNWHFNTAFGNILALAYMKPSVCPAYQLVYVWDASKWVLNNKIIIKPGLFYHKAAKQ